MTMADEVPAAVAGARTAVEILDAMDALLAEPRRWTKGAHARDPRGLPVEPRAAAADCWCLAGAHRVGRGQQDGTYSWFCIEVAVNEIGGSRHPTFFNDSPRTTFRDIKQVIARARDLAVRRRPHAWDGRIVRPFVPA